MSIKAIESKYLNSRNANLIIHTPRFALYVKKEDSHLCHILRDQKKYKDLGKMQNLYMDDRRDTFTVISEAVDNVRTITVYDSLTLKEKQKITVSANIPVYGFNDSFALFDEYLTKLRFFCEKKDYAETTVLLSNELSEELIKGYPSGTDYNSNPKKTLVGWTGPYLNKLVISTNAGLAAEQQKAHYYRYDREFDRIAFLGSEQLVDCSLNVVHFFEGRYNPITKKTYPPRVENKQRETQPA